MRAFGCVRRGRPKQAAANDNVRKEGVRKEGARKEERDCGTAELQMKRAQLARGLDPAAAAHPLDLLLAKGWVSEAAHRAGWRYAALYRQAIGRTAVSYGRFYDGLVGTSGRSASGVASDEADRARNESRFRRAKRDLLRTGAATAAATERLVVFGCWPDWLLLPDGIARPDGRRVLAGLAALLASFSGHKA
ncbi:MAG: hypothetical protein JNL25_11610 [Rhodospirillaceae bacterium]|nr:hypothetical protein [Rhodospirillaceae bacterium]